MYVFHPACCACRCRAVVKSAKLCIRMSRLLPSKCSACKDYYRQQQQPNHSSTAGSAGTNSEKTCNFIHAFVYLCYACTRASSYSKTQSIRLVFCYFACHFHHAESNVVRKDCQEIVKMSSMGDSASSPGGSDYRVARGQYHKFNHTSLKCHSKINSTASRRSSWLAGHRSSCSHSVPA